jgi:GNAT superfamily N-acetyltransferase
MARPPFEVRPARLDEESLVGDLLTAAAQWTVEQGFPNPWPVPYPLARIRPRIEQGEVYLAVVAGEPPVATVTLQWEDPPLWGERPPDAGYVHRLAVRRRHAGEGWGRRLIDWAEERVAERGRPLLRLDCVAANSGLVRYYSGLGFRRVGDVRFRDLDLARFERPVRARPAPDP